MGTNAPPKAPDFERTAAFMQADLRASRWTELPHNRWRSFDLKHTLPLATAWQVARRDAAEADDTPPFGPELAARLAEGGALSILREALPAVAEASDEELSEMLDAAGPALVRDDEPIDERSTDDLLDPHGSLTADDFAQPPAPDDAALPDWIEHPPGTQAPPGAVGFKSTLHHLHRDADVAHDADGGMCR